MMNYYGLDTPLRALLMSALFVLANLALVLILRVMGRKRMLHAKLLLPIISALNAFLCVMFATEIRATKFSRQLPEVVKTVCEMPIIVCILLIFASLGYITFVFFADLKFRKTHLSRASVKESLDKLPTGLCFYRENGRPILVNEVMYDLCYKIVGRDLQNARLFWEILSGGEVLPEVERLESGDHPAFRLPDGRVWSFSRETIDDILQLVASDTTDISNVNAELKAKNAELALVNARLREYGERVDELTRSRERIEIKANIHRELGQALLITRRFLVDDSEHAAPISVWKKNIAMLTREADYVGEESPLEMFMQAADAAGVEVKLDGKFPENQEHSSLFVTAAVECLVNGVRHAEAKTLYITIKEENGETSVVFENDGALPDREIVEGGGLSSIRYGVMRFGGRMEVRSKPKYSLTLTVPTEGVKSNVTV